MSRPTDQLGFSASDQRIVIMQVIYYFGGSIEFGDEFEANGCLVNSIRRKCPSLEV